MTNPATLTPEELATLQATRANLLLNRLLITAEDTDPAVTAYKAELCRIRNCAEDEENEIYLNTLVWANTPIFEM